MKRVFALLLALMLLLSACGKKNLSWQEKYDLGVKYLSEGNYKQALECFEFVISVEPKYADAYKGHAQASIGLAELLYRENPENPEIKACLESAKHDYAVIAELEPEYAVPPYLKRVEQLTEDSSGHSEKRQEHSEPSVKPQLPAEEESTDSRRSPLENQWENQWEVDREYWWGDADDESANWKDLSGVDRPWASEPVQPLSREVLVGQWNMIMVPNGWRLTDELCTFRFSEDGTMGIYAGIYNTDASIMSEGTYTADALGDGSLLVSANLVNYYEVEFGENYPGPGSDPVTAMFMFTLQGGVLRMEMLSSEKVLNFDHAGFQADLVWGGEADTVHGEPGMTREQAMWLVKQYDDRKEGEETIGYWGPGYIAYWCEEEFFDNDTYWRVDIGAIHDNGMQDERWSGFGVNKKWCFMASFAVGDYGEPDGYEETE